MSVISGKSISGHTHIFLMSIANKKIFRKFYFIPWPLLMIALSSVDRLVARYHDLIYAFILNKKHIAIWVWSLQLYSKWMNIVYTHMQAPSTIIINLVIQLSLIKEYYNLCSINEYCVISTVSSPLCNMPVFLQCLYYKWMKVIFFKINCHHVYRNFQAPQI